jgi:hypothetical protein
VGAEDNERLFELRSFRFTSSLSLVEAVDDVGCRLEGAIDPLAMKVGKLLSQGEVKGVMNGVKGSLLVGNQPIDRPLLYHFNLSQNLLYFFGRTEFEAQANCAQYNHPHLFCHQIPNCVSPRLKLSWVRKHGFDYQNL